MLATACLLSTLAPVSDAFATSVEIVFIATDGVGVPGSNTIAAAPGDTLTAMISIAADAAGVSIYGISLVFDMDVDDELQLISATELLNAPFMFNADPGCASTQESTGAKSGAVRTCEAATLAEGPTGPGLVDIIEVVFQVTDNVATDGFDIETGLFNAGFDGIFDNADQPVTAVYGEAAVNRVPEPDGLLLVGLGFLAVLRLRRRAGARRRQTHVDHARVAISV